MNPKPNMESRKVRKCLIQSCLKGCDLQYCPCDCHKSMESRFDKKTSLITPKMKTVLDKMFPQISRTYSRYDVERALEAIIPIALKANDKKWRARIRKMRNEFMLAIPDYRPKAPQDWARGYYQALDNLLQEKE